MKRVLVLGCCGAGKSTLARKLSVRSDLPVIHLDQYYWKAGWVETPQREWNEKVEELAAGERWIIDGNYVSSLGVRLDRAETIVFLHYSTVRCLFRVIRRIMKYRGSVRPDMPDGCAERFDLDFLHYVLMFNLLRGRALKRRLLALSGDKQVHVLTNDREVANWLTNIEH